MEELHSGSGGNAAMLQLIGVFEVIHPRSEKHVWSATLLGCHEDDAGHLGAAQNVELAGHVEMTGHVEVVGNVEVAENLEMAGHVEVSGHVETGGLGSVPAEHLRTGDVEAEHAGFG